MVASALKLVLKYTRPVFWNHHRPTPRVHRRLRFLHLLDSSLSRETDWPLFSKPGITSNLTVRLTSNWWKWKANSKLYFVSKDQLNNIVGRSPSISKHLTHLCNSALQFCTPKALKDPKIITFLQNVPKPENIWKILQNNYNVFKNTYIYHRTIYLLADVDCRSTCVSVCWSILVWYCRSMSIWSHRSIDWEIVSLGLFFGPAIS